MRILQCGSWLLIAVLAGNLKAASPPLLPADLSNRPQKSVLVNPPTVAPIETAGPTAGPTLAPLETAPPLQPVPKAAGTPRLAPVESSPPLEPQWQRIKDSAPEDSSEVSTAAAEVVVSEPVKLAGSQSLLDRFLRFPGALDSGQEAVSLDNLLARANESSLRLKIVKTYWAWTFQCARQRVLANQLKRLDAIRVMEQEQSRVNVARALLLVRQQQNALELIETRHQLSTLALVPTAKLTWPEDLPVVGKFRTEYEVLFQNRQAPPALEKINLVLPRIWQLLSTQSAAVEILEKSLQEMLDGQETNEASVLAMLAAWEQLEQVQLEYLATANRYNVEIADYVIAVTGQTASRERLVSMLIKPRRTTQSVLVPRR